jgi:plastocyanin
MQLRHPLLASILASCALLGTPALLPAAEPANDVILLRYQDNRFAPQTVTVPAGAPLTIKVLNSSTRTIEFESFKLNREKVVQPGQTITVHLPALGSGTYDFYDDFHQDVPQGSIVAR